MKASKLKVLFTAAGFFALSASFAQDTTMAPKPDTSKMPSDTTKMPMHDSTSMSTTNFTNDVAQAGSTTSTVVADDKAAKNQAEGNKPEKATTPKLPE